MGVYIRGMEMPRACIFCELYDGDLYWCQGAKKEVPYSPEDKRAEFCPLIELPPHGRLIVEDDAIETAWMILAGIGYRREENPQLEQTVREVYATAPTIEVE